MFVVSVLQAASSLAPSDKYHNNPQGGHRHVATSVSSSGGGGETSNATTKSNNNPASANNNQQFSHNGIPPPLSTSPSGVAKKLQQYDDQLMQSSSYHFYPSNSVCSSSITSSSHHLNHPHQQQQLKHLHQHQHQQPPCLYKSNHSSSGGSGNGIIIDGSNSGGSAIDGSNNKYYYYYNGYYYPTTAPELLVQEEGGAVPEEDPDQIFTITARTELVDTGSGKQFIMGRVGEDVYPPGSPASVGYRGNNGGIASAGLYKSKSSSIPVTTGSPQPHHRGFRETFISSMSPPVQVHSAESSPLHRSASATTANGSDRYSVKGNSSGGVAGSGSNKQENKKWSFGGLFRRNKTKAPVGASSPATSNNNSGVTENGGTSSANNSHCNSPAKVNNNYGSGSPIIIPNRTAYSPARPASSVGFVSKDPNYSFGSSGYIENHRPGTIISSSTSKFVNAEVQTRAKGKLSESDISTCDSDFDLALHQHDNPPEPAPQENNKGGYKQNFLVRRLSRRKEKAAAKKAAAEQATAAASSTAFVGSPKTSASGSSHHQHHNSSNGFISSQQHGYLDVPQMKRRVGSSPDSLNNSSEQWPSWETTKKPQSQLQALQQQHRLLQNYSSNGSLSVSQEGYNSNNNSSNNHGSKSSRAAVREAVKARAIARRESFLNDSSSSDDDTEERSQRSSLQGSFSSLNSRNRRQKAFNMQQAQFQQQRYLFPATTQAAGGISCASPSSPMPVPLDYRNSIAGIATSGMSPNMNRRLMMMGAPGSPKWETRVIYQQQDGATAPESSQPVVVRIPRNERMTSDGGGGGGGATTAGNPSQMSQNNGDQSFIMATEMISEDQHVVTAGLKVPFLPVQTQDQQCLIRNGQLMFPDDPVQYANVANGMRGRSCTPYMGYNNGAGDSSAIHHPSPTPPPPPPPRRDFTRATNNPNFYRPVSCSYLDSYANQLQMRQQSPLIHNGNYIYPVIQQHQQYQGQHETGMNGYTSHSAAAIPPVHNSVDAGAGIARSSPRHFVPAAAAENKNQADVDGTRHPPLIRSPSEPPVISRVDYARISSPVKRLISSPMSNGSNGESHLMDGSGKSSPSQNVITSKLGFPVRRLQEASKLTGPQNPVHLRASEFWRKKDTEVTGSPSPVGGNNSQQKKYLNRIRSADSSPLPVPKMRKSPGGVVASNESISSLSSFSENAASPGPPKNCSSPITNTGGKQSHPLKATPIRSQISKTPNPQQLTYGSNNKDKENNNTQHNQQQSAVERLKVRRPSAPDGIKSTSTWSNPPSSSTPTTSKITTGMGGGGGGDNGHNGGSNKSESNSNPIRALIELNNGKTPGKNLEDALNELEDMYKSLRLSDEDLLDRAERRDLPTAHQELRDAPLIPIPQAYHRFEHLGSAESLGTGSGSTGTNYTAYSGSTGGEAPQRVRAPPTRRSARPDTISDDMANRRLALPDGRPLDPRVVVAKTGSYLARAPAFSPCSSPCPSDVAQQQQLALTLALLGQEEEPDVTLDDVTFRNYKRANAIRIIEPQPLFGIPLGPITAAPASDYLHSKPTESYRPIFGHLKNPDVVNDDIAFRNLRKDLGQEANLTAKDWTPRLFSPNREVSFNYPKVKDGKKLRAIRSLSANITHMLPTTNSSSSGGNAAIARGSPTANLFQQQHHPRYDNSIGKWNSYGDLHRRASAGSPASTRASTYLQPSWVEQIEKLQTSTETLTDNRNSGGVSRLATAILDPPEHWERKFPKKTVELGPPHYDPDKPRRPWTDIILESFEKERQKEIERLAAEEAAANEAAVAAANNKTEAKNELDEDGVVDDDVFMDGAEQVKISGNSSKNNDLDESLQQASPNMDITSAEAYLQLLPGQKTRRGSWAVEQSRSYSNITSHHQDKRRKSWSDLPKDIDSLESSSTPAAIMLSGSSCSASPTRKLFNPLPPPKKIRQINLEAFNNNSNNNHSSVPQQQNVEENQADQLKSNLSSASGLNTVGIATSTQQADKDNHEENSLLTPSTDKVKSSSAKFREEDELNELMDQLLKDADACGQSIEEYNASSNSTNVGALNMKMNESVLIKEEVADKDKSLSTMAPPSKASVTTQKREMKMDGETSSSEQSCKQDLSCTIVGIIPKQQSPPPPPASSKTAQPTDRNNRKVQQRKQCSSSSSTSTSPPSTYSPNIDMDDDDASSSVSRKVLKIDNSNEKGNAVGVPKERKALSSSDPLPILQGRSKNKVATSTSQGVASSIEDLIESINESLPELEASIGSGGGSGSIGMITSSSSDVKPNGSSSASGSPASSIPSPSPGSPIPPVLSVSVIEKAEGVLVADENGGLLSPSSSAFPVAAKRHHFPSREAVVATEESIYENIPAQTMMMMKQQSKTGNDEKVCSSSPYTLAYDEQKSESSNKRTDPYNLEKASKGKIPPLLTPTSVKDEGSRRSTSSRNKPGGRRALHDSNNDEDNEDEDAQHSSSHQPSSLSSNDSCDVSGGGGVGRNSPRENANLNKNQSGTHQRQKNDNSNANNNNIRDNINEDQVGETSSSLQTSLPSSSVPFDASISSFDTTAFSNNQNNNQTMTPTPRRMSSNSDASSTSSSARETQFRKKSEAGTKEEEDKKMMKNTRSTRRKSRSTSRIIGRSRSCVTSSPEETRRRSATEILLDFVESGERIKFQQQEKQEGNGEHGEQQQNNNHQNQGFARTRQQVYRDLKFNGLATTVVVNKPPAVQTNSNFLNESESWPTFPELSPGESAQQHLGGILSKRARRTRMFQLSTPTVDLLDEDTMGYDLSMNYCRNQQQQKQQCTLDKNEKWQKMIEIMEESPLLVSPPKSITQSRTTLSTTSSKSTLGETSDDAFTTVEMNPCDNVELSRSMPNLKYEEFFKNFPFDAWLMPYRRFKDLETTSSKLSLWNRKKNPFETTCKSKSPLLSVADAQRVKPNESLSKIGSLHSHPNNSTQKSYPQQATRQANLIQQNHNFLPRGEISNSKNGFGEKSDKRNEIRETFIGNKRVTSSSSPSSSATEDTATSIPTQRNAKEQPVARSRTSSSAFPSSFNQPTNTTTQAKKSSTSTTLATPSAPAVETSASETGNGGISFLRNNFPFFRNSTSRSRSQSVISDVSRSSETGESKKEKDKSYRRKSHLNRAFTDEPVPDNNYTYDATPKSSKPASSHDASSRENSAVEESRANHKPSVKLHPAIPPVLTSNKSDSNMSPNKSISRNNSYTQNEMIPSPLPTNSHKSSPVVKKDSFSDAEGVSFIKKMLQKESDRDRAAAAAGGSGTRQNSQNGSSTTVNSSGSTSGYNIKKSPSAGNQSYWSKFSSSQSAFLRKLFEKPKVSESPVNLSKTVQKTNSSVNCTQSGENGEKDSLEKENEGEPVLGFSVAQKASFFMKLEHEQRFSKWRKNSVDLGVISSVTDHQTGENSRLNASDTQGINEARQQSRFLTRPVTPLEGNFTELSSNNGNSISKNVEFGSLPRMWGDKFHSLENKVAQSSENIIRSDNNPSSVQTSSFTDYDDKQKYEHVGIQSGSRKFTEISTRNMKPVSPYTVIEPAVKSYSLTRSSRHNGTSDKILESNLGSFPMYHSASAIINTTAAPAPSTSSSGKHSSIKPSMKFHKNLGNSYNSSSSSSFSEALSRNDSVKFLPVIAKKGMSGGIGEPSPTVYENSVGRSSNNDQRRGSASDLELSGAANNSPLMSRSEKVKSMFISRNRYHGDTDNLSEDGEVSSGGQEVAEIICRSYENSPVFRKKNWRAQKQVQSNFTKEIWRRCGNYESWSHRPQPQQPQHQRQQPQHPVPQTFTATTNVIEVTTIPPTLPSVAASPPPSTSNLLQILTVLSSSNDELNEPRNQELKSKKHRQGSRDKLSGSSSRSDSIPPMHPNHSVIQPRVSTANCLNHNSVRNNPGPVSTNHHRHTMPPTPTDNSDVIYVSVPDPQDEAFQSFFCSVKSYTNVSHFPPTNGVIVANLTSNNQPNQLDKFSSAAMVGGMDGDIQREAGLVDETLDISSVRRESDLLVMKKNVPTCKRKSIGSKYKNPLRALAARMDFRQQGYTQTHSTNSNSVQCSSDVDVST